MRVGTVAKWMTLGTEREATLQGGPGAALLRLSPEGSKTEVEGEASGAAAGVARTQTRLSAVSLSCAGRT